tara:strand:- start:44 stop:487 length:444 start_codon:yes stop_codon:yes gene_type:complete
MPIKSFRAEIADNEIQTINLHTNNGSIGYRIKKLQGLPRDPFQADGEHVIKIFKIPQTTADDTIDFSDNTLLAALTFNNASTSSVNYAEQAVIFDNEIFNQDIFVTHVDARSSQIGNYYIELEQIKLDLNENTVATLKDIRNIKSNE